MATKAKSTPVVLGGKWTGQPKEHLDADGYWAFGMLAYGGSRDEIRLQVALTSDRAAYQEACAKVQEDCRQT